MSSFWRYVQNAVQPAAWQSSLPAEIIHAASQPPASDQLVMHQPYVDGAQHQQVQHHEAVDDGAHEMPHMHRVIEDHHAAHAVLPPPEQPELYSNGEEDFRHMEAAAALSPALKEGLDEAIHVEATVPDDNGVNDGSKRHHTTHPAHVEPALKPDSVPASVCFFTAPDRPWWYEHGPVRTMRVYIASDKGHSCRAGHSG